MCNEWLWMLPRAWNPVWLGIPLVWMITFLRMCALCSVAYFLATSCYYYLFLFQDVYITGTLLFTSQWYQTLDGISCLLVVVVLWYVVRILCTTFSAFRCSLSLTYFFSFYHLIGVVACCWLNYYTLWAIHVWYPPTKGEQSCKMTDSHIFQGDRALEHSV